jgi:ABC-type glycerol-3-phosphate transport system substrate-binding protein
MTSGRYSCAAILLLMGLLALSGTGPSISAAQEPTLTVTPLVAGVVIWWPAALYPEADSTAQALLNDHLARYERERGVQVTIRVKRTDGVGSISSTLLPASVVAPGVVPDLVLLRRADLVATARAQLAAPISLAALSIDDWFAAGIGAGQLDGTQVGIPYALNVQHTLVRRVAFSQPPTTLGTIISAGQSYWFPGSAGANLTVLAQYLGAGGRFADERGLPVLDRVPLLAMLTEYERAAAATLIDNRWLEYSSPSQYLLTPAFAKVNVAQIDSWAYLRLTEAGDFGVGPLPLPSGAVTGMALVESWQWVVTAADPAQRERALDVLRWLLDSRRYGAFTRELGVLPARRTALQTWKNDYAAFAEGLLEAPALPPIDTLSAVVTSALQTAFEDVITGKLTAQAATDAALAKLP